MKKNIVLLSFLILIVTGLLSCLKSTPLYTDYGSTQPMADIPKAPANALTGAAPTNSWIVLDTLNGGVDYLTAVHLSAKDHVGDVTLKMKIDTAAATVWINAHPSAGYKLIPDSLYTVSSLEVIIRNAGVFSTGDFPVRINTNAKDTLGNKLFKVNKFILPVMIESVEGANYQVASNFQYILWYIRIK